MQTRPGRVRFGPERTSFVPVVVLALGAAPLALSDSRLLVVLLVPLLCAVWVARAHVGVAPDGLEVCNGLRRHRLPWDAVEGYDLPARGPACVLTRGGRRRMTALPRHRLRALVEASAAASAPRP